jgi:hypothetical protein
MVMTTSRHPGLPSTPARAPQRPTGVPAQAPALPSGPAVTAAMAVLRATAIRTLREHVPHQQICAHCRARWPCEPVHLAATALGMG